MNFSEKKFTIWSFFIRTPNRSECKLRIQNFTASANSINLKNSLKRSQLHRKKNFLRQKTFNEDQSYFGTRTNFLGSSNLTSLKKFRLRS